MFPSGENNRQDQWRKTQAERRRKAGNASYRARLAREGPEYWRTAFDGGRHLGTAAFVAKATGKRRKGFLLHLKPEEREKLINLSHETGISACALVRACLARSLPAVVGAHRRALADKQALKRFSERVIRDSAREWEVE